MQTGEPALIGSIRRAIRRDGPLPFASFMEAALYHPEGGYYSSGRAMIGRTGDYFTSVSVGSLFGQMLAAQFAEMWDSLGRPTTFTIVEQGAHGGDFAHDVLSAVGASFPEFGAALHYCIVEPFPMLRARQAERLADFGRGVSWCDSLSALAPFCGVHFSNELLDAMPVHVIQRTAEGGWNELLVDANDDGFFFAPQPLSNQEIIARVGKFPAVAPAHLVEICLASIAWIGGVSAKLERGFVLTADYGFSRHAFFAAERCGGTLRAYRQHRVGLSPFEEVGRTDLTAHVDWTGLAEDALSHGLSLAGFADQHHFLSALATGLCVVDFGAGASASTRRRLQTLLHPTFLGRAFQFLAFSRGVAPEAKLDGFRLAADPRRSLGFEE